MKVFKERCAQGDVMFIRVDSIPADAKLVTADSRGYFVIAKSETHHDHVVKAAPNVQFYTTSDPQISYLQVIEATDAMETVLEHLRAFDTHEAIRIDAGIYELRRQREYTPEGWRRVAD